MLQQIRDKSSTKVFYSLLMLLVIGGLLFFGIGDYSFGGSQPFVAKVGDEIISEDDFAKRMQEQQNQMRQMMGESYNAKMFDTPQFRRQVLDQLIDEELITQAGTGAGMAVSDSKVREEIGKIESFKREGKFDEDLYREVLKSNRMSPTQFDARLRRDIAVRELPSQITATALVTSKEVGTFVRLRDQLRSFRYLSLPPTVIAPESISDEQIKKYFDAHSIDYVTPEQVSVEYVELNGASIARVEANESQLRQQYQEQSLRFGTNEQRLASHVLIEVAESADAKAQKVAQDKAAAVAAELSAGKEFALVAQTSSEDIGSKESGGDLGWIEKGSMEPAFEQALFALEAGKVSAPVRTRQGYHIIALREIRPAVTKSFDEVRAELESEFIEEQRVQQFTEFQDKLFAAADHTSGTLEPLAKTINAQVLTSELFTREFGPGIAVHPGIREAAFSLEVKDDGLTSEPIELSKEHVVVIRLAQHKASQPRSLEVAKDEVRTLLVSEASSKSARDAADAALKRLLGGETLDAIASGQGVVEAKDIGRQGATHDAALVSEVFKMARPAAAAVTNGLAKLSESSYALVQLQSVVDGDVAKLDEAARTAANDQIRQELAAAETEAFRKALRARVPVLIDETKI
ncbi:MAG: SurA N-terminal domain-containing protein [Pseudomonadota bacterium]|nr:SurA N-terminal domain-containing protein [Pseudomonadota bacterium]